MKTISSLLVHGYDKRRFKIYSQLPTDPKQRELLMAVGAHARMGRLYGTFDLSVPIGERYKYNFDMHPKFLSPEKIMFKSHMILNIELEIDDDVGCTLFECMRTTHGNVLYHNLHNTDIEFDVVYKVVAGEIIAGDLYRSEV